MERALHDERRAEAEYAALDAAHGATTPFPRIVKAERRHAAELERVLAAHGETIPAPASTSPSAAAASAAEACKVGAASERANITLYGELLARPLPADVRCVFERLRSASADRHLPAFERCAAR